MSVCRLAIAFASMSLLLSGCSEGQPAAVYERLVKNAHAALSSIGIEINKNAESTAPDDKTKRKTSRKGKRGSHVVEVAQVSVNTLRLESVYTGSLRSRRTVRIFNQEEGRLVTLPFFEGDVVAQGELLLALDDALLAAEHAKKVALQKESESNLARIQGLRRKRMVPENEFLRAVTTVEVAKAEAAMLRIRLGYARVLAPFSGTVAKRLAEPGDILAKHSHVLTIIDPLALVIDLDVSEMLLAHIKEGTNASVRIDALGDASYRGKVVRIHPSLDAKTRQGRVEVSLNPLPTNARPGQFARATFSVAAPARKTIPFAALRRDVGGEYVMRIDTDNRAQKVAVRSGRRVADRVEVMDGLAVSDTVVTRGFLGLEPGTKVEALTARQTPVSAVSGS